MGTSYRISVVAGELDREALQEDIQARLDRIDTLMSSWVSTSDINRINSSDRDEPITVDPETAQVLNHSLSIADLTSGAFDISMSPLIELWGFGTRDLEAFPQDDAIRELLTQTGPGTFSVTGQTVTKLHPKVTLNVSAIAKGYAVDKVHELLTEKGFTDHLVEVGGEVFAAGISIHRKPWRVGLEAPDPVSRTPEVHQVVRLSGMAVATSGNYRNFFWHEGKQYTHIIDPRTGYPIPSYVTSVSVIAKDCMSADAMATACMVLGVEASLKLMEEVPDAECMLVEEKDGKQLTHFSSGMGSYL
ncbi:MAG: FAD:protein FMN transferase [Acidobacteria bacterium]|nr:FAD:protein FMN transferase [Acidobacteriota bacterium]